jgi:superfamily I DNA/RNA helicase
MERLLAASHEWQSSVYGALGRTDELALFNSRTRQSIVEFRAFIDRTRAQLFAEPLARQPDALQNWAGQFLNEIGYFNDLRRSEKNQETGENRVRNLRELIATLDQESAAQPVERLAAFLECLALDNERDQDELEHGDAVTLITMHSCKGLEFPHVYIVGLEDGLLPHAHAKAENTLDEERRLFYVAITRAMESLTISHCLGRKKYGQVLPCQPSPFLKELPPELLERADERAKQPVSPGEGKHRFANLREALG